MIYRALRPLLFRLEPERAHALVVTALRLTGAFPPLRSIVRASLASPTAKPVELFGLSFANPVGIAAGFDKDGLAWRGLACLGPGHVEIGTVTPAPQPGNARPRLFREPAERALVNRLGFPSRGADFVARRLAGRSRGGLALGVNIGKQRETPLDRAAEDYELLVERFAGLADYLALNVSSPNTPELRRLQEPAALRPLLERLTRRLPRPRVPLLVKLAPDLDSAELDGALDAILAAGIDGVIATNTMATTEGGRSGAPLAERSTGLVRAIVQRTEGRLPVIACGGVMSAEDARVKLDAGARLVQLYTGLVYEGPALVKRIVAGLSARAGRPAPRHHA
jgi:dihydroorotate dehydrogenase